MQLHTVVDVACKIDLLNISTFQPSFYIEVHLAMDHLDLDSTLAQKPRVALQVYNLEIQHLKEFLVRFLWLKEIACCILATSKPGKNLRVPMYLVLNLKML